MLKKNNTNYIVDFQYFNNFSASDLLYIANLLDSYAKKHLGAKDYLILLQAYD